MKLFEYQAQELFSMYQIPVPEGKIARNTDEVYDIVSRMKDKAVIKAQVLTGGRGKAGGVRIAASADEARSVSRDILGMKIKDNPVNTVLVAPAVGIVKEFYTSIVVNNAEKRVECIICGEGGIEIEEVASSSPEKIHKIPLNREIFSDKRILLDKLKKIFEDDLSEKFIIIMEKMFNLFVHNDCLLVEINPLALDKNMQLVALDAKIILDDNGLYRHPELEKFRNTEEYSIDELDAKKFSLAFVGLSGTIGCMVNGAGLAMATMDLIKYFGGEPANFLDIGGSSNPKKVIEGLMILLRNKNIKAVLLNIFGGITRCDDIANGLLEAEKELDIDLPMVIRLIGTNDREAIEILEKNGFTAFSGLSEAVKTVVRKSKGEG